MNTAKWISFLHQTEKHLLSCHGQHIQPGLNYIQVMGICLMFYGESLMRPAERKFVEIKSP